MQDLQPMHRLGSKSTMPSGRLKSALVGQIVTHGASAQWLQRSTVKKRRVLGKLPFSVYFTQVRKTPSGTSFSDLHATVQAWQPMHLRWSMTKPKRVSRAAGCGLRAAGIKRHIPDRRSSDRGAEGGSRANACQALPGSQ